MTPHLLENNLYKGVMTEMIKVNLNKHDILFIIKNLCERGVRHIIICGLNLTISMITRLINI